MSETTTTFGTVRRWNSGTSITADGATLRDWAWRGTGRWPCSTLATLEAVKVTFDSVGDVVSIEGVGPAGIESAELYAWASEVLERAGYPNHPAIRPVRS